MGLDGSLGLDILGQRLRRRLVKLGWRLSALKRRLHPGGSGTAHLVQSLQSQLRVDVTTLDQLVERFDQRRTEPMYGLLPLHTESGSVSRLSLSTHNGEPKGDVRRTQSDGRFGRTASEWPPGPESQSPCHGRRSTRTSERVARLDFNQKPPCQRHKIASYTPQRLSAPAFPSTLTCSALHQFR